MNDEHKEIRTKFRRFKHFKWTHNGETKFDDDDDERTND